MIEQRTLLPPKSGAGIVNPEPPTKEYKRYPLVMTHPGYQPGVPDKEEKIIDPQTGKWTGYLKYSGSQAIRFGPVLVKDQEHEEYHASQGYVAAQENTSEAAFLKFVQSAVPVQPDYKPIEYPKMVNGKVVQNAEEEAEILGVVTDKMAAAGAEAIADADPKSALFDAEAAASDAYRAMQAAAPVETKEERIARLKRELAELEETETPARGPDAPLVVTDVAPSLSDVGSGQPAEKPWISSQASAVTEDAAAAKRTARSEAIKAGLARKKAEKAKATEA